MQLVDGVLSQSLQSIIQCESQSNLLIFLLQYNSDKKLWHTDAEILNNKNITQTQTCSTLTDFSVHTLSLSSAVSVQTLFI